MTVLPWLQGAVAGGEDNEMRKAVLAVAAAAALAAVAAVAQTAKPTIVVDAFTVQKGLGWPYSFQLLQKEMIAKLTSKLTDKVTVVDGAPGGGGAYTLDGEILRMYQNNNIDAHAGGMATNNQIITVRYWLTGPDGKKVFDKTSTYTATGVGIDSQVDFNGAGPIARDLEADVVSRVKDAKIYSGR